MPARGSDNPSSAAILAEDWFSTARQILPLHRIYLYIIPVVLVTTSCSFVGLGHPKYVVNNLWTEWRYGRFWPTYNEGAGNFVSGCQKVHNCILPFFG